MVILNFQFSHLYLPSVRIMDMHYHVYLLPAEDQIWGLVRAR